MEKYEKPICEVIVLEWGDVITTSDDIEIGNGDNLNEWTEETPYN